MKMLVNAQGGPRQGGTVALHLRGPSLTGLREEGGMLEEGFCLAQRSRALARRQESLICPCFCS